MLPSKTHFSKILISMVQSSALPITKQPLKPLLGVHGRKAYWLQAVVQGTNA